MASKEYEIAYQRAKQLLKPFDGICPRDCNLCEERELLVLLPGEKDFISEDHAPLSLLSSLAEAAVSNLACPAKCECTNSCTIYPSRPIDCRSFPVVPTFEPDGSVSTRVSHSYCPIADSLPDGFVAAVHAAWTMLRPHLSAQWMERFNRTPSPIDERLMDS